jgi:hypothetical protein
MRLWGYQSLGKKACPSTSIVIGICDMKNTMKAVRVAPSIDMADFKWCVLLTTRDLGQVYEREGEREGERGGKRTHNHYTF